MAHAPTSVLLTIASVEGSAALILFVICLLLLSSFPARFFRYWVIGWAFFFSVEASQIAFLLRDIDGSALVGSLSSLCMAAFFFGAAFECSGVAAFRVSVEGLLIIASGIAMAVLVLETSRARNDDLNEKLRRLSLLTAEATQSLRVDKALDGILTHLVASLGATHGLVFLQDESSGSPMLRSRPQPEGTGSKILLVESEDAVSQLEEAILNEHAISVRKARSTWEATDILKRESFDAAIMDVKIPGEISTPALCDWIEQNRPELARRIVFTSSATGDSESLWLPAKFGCPCCQNLSGRRTLESCPEGSSPREFRSL